MTDNVVFGPTIPPADELRFEVNGVRRTDLEEKLSKMIAEWGEGPVIKCLVQMIDDANNKIARRG